MNSHEFVEAIRIHVMEAAASDAITVVRNPPGRSPAPELVELSRWFAGLTSDDHLMLERFSALVARYSIFGMFAVLDGARQIDPAADVDDYFELRLVRRDATDILCSPEGDPLHELL